MPELAERVTHEGRLARSLARASAARLALLAEDPTGVDQDFWAQTREETARAAADHLEAVFVAAALALMQSTNLWIDDLVKIQIMAADWASGYAAKLAADLTNNTEKAYRKLIDRAAREGWDDDRLLKRLYGLYGASRLETIAITEVTRAQAEGEKAVAFLLSSLAVAVLEPYHFTANDERVCPICGSRHGVKIMDGIYAPLHPRCRCRTEWLVMQPDEKGGTGGR